jgi:outer membrane protein assembly factor BamB
MGKIEDRQPGKELPRPPFRRVWTYAVGLPIEAVAVGVNVAYVVDAREVGALDLLTGEMRWRSRLPAFGPLVRHVACDDRYVYLSLLHGNRSMLVAYDAATGRRWWKKRVGLASRFAVDGELLVTQWKQDAYVALDPVTRRVRWTVRRDRSGDTPEPPHLAGDLVLLPDGDTGILAIERKSGAMRWHVEASGAALIGTVDGLAIGRLPGTVVAWRLATGEPVWEHPVQDRFEALLVGESLVVPDSETVTFLAAETGRVRERYRYRRPRGVPPSAREVVAGRGQVDRGRIAAVGRTVVLEDRACLAFDATGRRLWRSSHLHGLTALWSNGEVLVASDPYHLYGFVHGKPPSIPKTPSDRVALAEALVPQFDRLDARERQIVGHLLPESFPPLLRLWIDVGLRRGKGGTSEHALRLPLTRFEESWEILQRGMSPATTPLVVDAIRRLPRENVAVVPLIDLLRHGADPQVAGPVLLEYVRAVPPSRWSSDARIEHALDALASQAYDPGLDLLIGVLDSPQVSPAVYERLYTDLARSGARGAAAVVRHRRREPIQPERWPGIERQAESDAEKATEAAFDAVARFGWAQPIQVGFPEGIAPFAMHGAQALCYGDDSAFRDGRARWRIDLFFVNEPPPERAPEGTTARLIVDTYVGPTSAQGMEVEVRKFGSEWAPLSVTRVWVA